MAAFDWANYLILAKELSGRASDEAALRSAVSRAYYAAFNHARLFCEANNISIPDTVDQSHAVVWNALLGKSRTLSGAEANGKRLKRKRREADYEHEIENLSKLAEQAIHESDLVFAYLQIRSGGPQSNDPK